MPNFRVHYVAPNGNKLTTPVSAPNPDPAAAAVRRLVPGATVVKTKADRSRNKGTKRATRAELVEQPTILNGRRGVAIVDEYESIEVANSQTPISQLIDDGHLIEFTIPTENK